jgi:hypothetical protein
MLVLLVTGSSDLIAQVKGHDMVILRNSRGRTVKSYFNGINFEGADVNGRGIYGVIRNIREDSIFIQTYDVRKQYNMWGTSVLDTVTSYLTPYAVNEVKWIRKPPAKFEFVRNGSLFMIGGSAYLVLHVINAAYLKQPVIGSTVSIAGGIAVTGFIMNKLRKRQYVIGKGYELKYVGME